MGRTDVEGLDPRAKLHRALSSPVRQRLLEILGAHGDPQDVRQLAGQLGLHPNTVRAHLTLLTDAGLTLCEPAQRDGPGRPRLVYRAVDRPDERENTGGYRFLAEILASHLAGTSDDPAGAAAGAGRTWGRHLVERPIPFETLKPAAAINRVVGLLTDFGFAPELDDDPTTTRILLRRCPFLDVAKDHPDIVCAIHLGLMRGALAELGVDVAVRDLQPFVEPTLCISHLEVGT